MQTVTGLFETSSQAQIAVNALAGAGIAREEITSVSLQDAMSDAETASKQGEYVVTVRSSNVQAELAISILKQSGAVNVDEIRDGNEAREETELPITPEDYRREDNPADDTLPPPLPR